MQVLYLYYLSEKFGGDNNVSHQNCVTRGVFLLKVVTMAVLWCVVFGVAERTVSFDWVWAKLGLTEIRN